MIDLISYEKEIMKEELKYRLSGEYENLEKTKYEASNKLRNLLNEKKQAPQININKYNNELKYRGDNELLSLIFQKEKEFRIVRKNIEKKIYEEKLKELVNLRNKYAITAGFDNYLDYRYALWGIDKNSLNTKANEVYLQLKDKTLDKNFSKYFNEINNIDIFDKSNQIQLLRETLRLFNFKLDSEKVIIHAENLPSFYLGACVPVNIPNEIHVLMNMNSGLNGFAIFMHEIGHAFYYSSIDDKLEGDDKYPYNLILEEGIALLFENLVFTSEFLYPIIGRDVDLFDYKANAFLLYQICCAMFENDIYINPDSNYDDIWKKYSEIYIPNDSKGWTSPHFFVSEPAYFSAYFLGGCWARDIYLFIRNNKNIDINDFLIENVCRLGGKIDYQKFKS